MKEKVKNIFNWYGKVFTLFVPIVVILLSIWFITIIITGSKGYYSWQFKKNNTLENLTWVTRDGELMEYTDEDLLEIRDAIIEYLFNKRESMQVEINGHEFFSYQALEHMRLVRNLFNRWTIITVVLFILLIPWIVYFIINRHEIIGKLFKPTYITYSILAGILLVLGIMMIINFDWTFTWFHHVLFPKQSEFNDAFFTRKSNYQVDNDNPYINNLLLVTVLSIEVFMDAAWIIVAFIIIILAFLFIFTFKKREKNKKTLPN